MGNLIKPYEILREKPPVVEIEVSLNIAYINIIFQRADLTSSPIDKVIIEILEYDNDILISEEIVSFYPGQTSYAQDVPQKPIHSVYKKINNNQYIFNIIYTYRPSPSNVGNTIFYSQQTSIPIDNKYPQIYTNLISKYIKGLVFKNIEKSNITIWHNDLLNIETDIKKGDIVNFESGIQMVENTIDGIVLEPLDSSYIELFLFFKSPDVIETINTYFNGELPEDGEIPFYFNYNKRYCITIKGNLKKFYEPYMEALND